MCTLNDIVQDMSRQDKITYNFFEIYKKRDCLWYKLWDMGIKGRMWRVIKEMYESSKSVVLLEREKSDTAKAYTVYRFCTYICYAQSTDSDHPRILLRKPRIRAFAQ